MKTSMTFIAVQVFAGLLLCLTTAAHADVTSQDRDAEQGVPDEPKPPARDAHGPVAADWSFSFDALRRRIDTVDEEALDAVKRPSPETDGHVPGMFMDGVVWGRGDDRYAGQFYDAFDRSASRTWRHFNVGQPPAAFPRNTYIFGRGPGFFWYGYCGSRVTIHPAEGAEPRHEAAIWTFDELVAFSREPSAAFERFAIRGREGKRSRDRVVAEDGAVIDTHRFKTATAYEYILITDRGKADGELQRWAYYVKDLGAGKTTVWKCELRPDVLERRQVPAHPEDLPKVHRDVSSMPYLNFIDLSGLGEWESGNVRYQEDLPPARRRSELPVISIVIAAAIATIVGRVLYSQHSSWRRQQS